MRSWSVYGYIHQNGRSVICLWVSVPEHEVTHLFAHVGPRIWDLHVTIIPVHEVSFMSVCQECKSSDMFVSWMNLVVRFLFVCGLGLSVWGPWGLLGCRSHGVRFGGLFNGLWTCEGYDLFCHCMFKGVRSVTVCHCMFQYVRSLTWGYVKKNVVFDLFVVVCPLMFLMSLDVLLYSCSPLFLSPEREVRSFIEWQYMACDMRPQIDLLV